MTPDANARARDNHGQWLERLEADLLLEGRRWRFERDRPRGLRDLPGRRRRATPAVSLAGGFNWRRSFGEDVAEIFREQILGTRSSHHWSRP